jgi:hypothetical protein
LHVAGTDAVVFLGPTFMYGGCQVPGVKFLLHKKDLERCTGTWHTCWASSHSCIRLDASSPVGAALIGMTRGVPLSSDSIYTYVC